MSAVSGLRYLLWGIVAVVQCNAGTVVTTLDVWDGHNSICCFASNQGAGTMGEIITAPATDALLTSFTLVIANNAFGPMPFRAYVAGWNGSMVTGPLLYASPVEFSGTASAFTEFTFNPNTALTPGAAYILFAGNAETDFAAFPGNLGMGYLGSDIAHGVNAYPGGGMRFLPKGLPVSSWSTTPWLDPTAFGDSSPNNDLPFSAVFGVPEPASLLSATLGITFLALIAARRRSALLRGR
jgi:hypothetical protein